MNPGTARSVMGFPAEPVSDPQQAWREALSRTDGKKRTLYIHIPFCRSRCDFCGFYFGSATREERRSYAALLTRELLRWSAPLQESVVNTVYLGGGTPSDLAPEEISMLLTALRRNYPLANDCEITLESRIDGWDEAKLDAALASGVNRFSLGVQSFDTLTRRSLGRVSDREKVLEVLELLTRRNQAAVSVDLLYGLPGQTVAHCLRDLETARRETRVSGISFYRLNLHAGLELSRRIAAGTLPPLPSEEELFAIYHAGEDYLAQTGARRLSLKHFAFDTRERNLHNELSAQRCDCLPFGLLAGGRLGPYQFKQTNDPEIYRQMVEADAKPLLRAGKPAPDSPVCFTIAGQMLSQLGLDLTAALAGAPDKLRDKLRNVLEKELQKQENNGYITPERFGMRRLTASGRFRCVQLAAAWMTLVAEHWSDQ